MPPSTCWQCLAAVRPACPRRPWPAVRQVVVAPAAQRRLGAVDRHQRLGEPVADRLERRDRAAELGPGRARAGGPVPAWRASCRRATIRAPRGRPPAARHPRSSTRRDAAVRGSIGGAHLVRAFPDDPVAARRTAARRCHRGSRSDRVQHDVVEHRARAHRFRPAAGTPAVSPRRASRSSMSAQPRSTSAASSSAPEADSMVLRKASSSKPSDSASGASTVTPSRDRADGAR